MDKDWQLDEDSDFKGKKLKNCYILGFRIGQNIKMSFIFIKL